MKNFSTKNTFTYGQHGNNCVSSKLKPIPWFYPENKKKQYEQAEEVYFLSLAADDKLKVYIIKI